MAQKVLCGEAPSFREAHVQRCWPSSFSPPCPECPNKHPHLGLSQMASSRRSRKSQSVPLVYSALFKSYAPALFHNWFLFLYHKHGEHKLQINRMVVRLHFHRKLLSAYSAILNQFINCINTFTRVLSIQTRHFLKYLHLVLIKYTQFRHCFSCYNREHIFNRDTKEKVSEENQYFLEYFLTEIKTVFSSVPFSRSVVSDSL